MTISAQVDGVGTLQFPDGTDPAVVQATVKKMIAQKASEPLGSALPVGGKGYPTPPAGPTSMSDSLINGAKNLYGSFLEPAATIASGAVAVPVARVASIGQAMNNAIGLGPQQDPEAVRQSMQSALTYQPRTDAGKSTTNLVGDIASLPGKAMDAIGLHGALDPSQYGKNISDLTGSPVLGQLAAGGLEALPVAAGTKLPEIGAAKVADAAQAAVDAAPAQQAIDAARSAGYHLPPSEITSAPTGKLLTGVAGKNQLNDVLSLANQKNTNRIAKTEAQVPANVPFTPASLDDAATAAGKSYDAVRTADQNIYVLKDANGNPVKNASGKVVYKQAGPMQADPAYSADVANIGADRANPILGPDPEVDALKAKLTNATSSVKPNDAITSINSLRSDARANMKATDSPDQLALGRAQMQAADAMEARVARYLNDTGQPTLYNNFTASRTRLAKINTIRDAMDASGNVDASAINAYRNNGGYVDGGLKQIADAADSFGNVVKNTSKVQAPAPVSALSYVMGMSGAPLDIVAGHAAGGTAAAAAALMAARPASRAVLNSEWYQNLLRGQSPTAGTLSQLAAQPGSPLAGLALNGTSQSPPQQ